MLTEELRNLLGTGPALYVGSASPGGEPDCIRAWGADVTEDGLTIRLLFPGDTAATLIANARAGGEVALSFTNVKNYASYQAKGELLGVEVANAQDRVFSERYREAFTADAMSIGVPRVIRNCAFEAAQVVVFSVTALYEQTPGPLAGEAIAGRS